MATEGLQWPLPTGRAAHAVRAALWCLRSSIFAPLLCAPWEQFEQLLLYFMLLILRHNFDGTSYRSFRTTKMLSLRQNCYSVSRSRLGTKERRKSLRRSAKEADKVTAAASPQCSGKDEKA